MKQLFFALFCLFSSQILAQNVIVKGEIEGLDEPEELTIAVFVGMHGKVIFSDSIKSATFECSFAAPSEEIAPCMLSFENEKWGSRYRMIYLKPGATYTLKGNAYDLLGLQISSEQVAEQAYETEYSLAAIDYERKQHAYTQEMYAITDKARKETDESIKNELKGKRTELLKKIQELSPLIQSAQLSVLVSQPYSAVKKHHLQFLINMLGTSPALDNNLAMVYQSLPQEIKEEDWAKTLAAKFKNTDEKKEGDLIDGTFTDLQGKTITLSSFRGKYVLLDIWASACQPCMAALPELESISRDYADVLHVVSVSFDHEEIWRTTSQRHPMSWYNLNDKESQLSIPLRIIGYPTFFLIDPSGKIIARKNGYSVGSLLEFVSSVKQDK